MATQLTLPTADVEVPGSDPTGGRIDLMTVWNFIAEPFNIQKATSDQSLHTAAVF